MFEGAVRSVVQMRHHFTPLRLNRQPESEEIQRKAKAKGVRKLQHLLPRKKALMREMQPMYRFGRSLRNGVSLFYDKSVSKVLQDYDVDEDKEDWWADIEDYIPS